MRQLKITKQITNRDSPALEKYLLEIGREEMITPEEEVNLARRIKQGDHEALERLTTSNLRFVVSVAKQYQNQGLTLNDLINEGNLGLIKAAQRFDETKGFKFISYAVWWIRQSILQSLAEHSRIVRLPLNKIGDLNKVGRAFIKLEQEYEREPSHEELADVMDMTYTEMTDLLKGNNKHISMNAPLIEGEEGSLIDLMEDNDDKGTDKELINESLRSEIKRVLSILPKRDSEVVSCFFGVNGQPIMTLDEIGHKFDLTRERVRQIKERSIRRLRKASISKSLKSYLG